MSVQYKFVIHCSCKVHALSSAEHVTFVEMVLFHGLDYVNILFAFKYANFVACVDQHENEKQDAAQRTCFR